MRLDLGCVGDISYPLIGVRTMLERPDPGAVPVNSNVGALAHAGRNVYRHPHAQSRRDRLRHLDARSQPVPSHDPGNGEVQQLGADLQRRQPVLQCKRGFGVGERLESRSVCRDLERVLRLSAHHHPLSRRRGSRAA